MFVFPLAAAIVAAAFSVATWRAASERNVALRIWSVALGQFAAACVALVWGVVFGWTPLVYRAFYLLGAVLNVAWLALGTIWLLAPRRVASVINVLFILAATAACVVVMGAELRSDALTAKLPSPADVMSEVPRTLSRIFSLGGSVIVLVGLLWSLVRRRFAVGLGLLAAGVVITGIASGLIRAGRVELFSVGLAAGIAVMYAGFLRTRG